MSIYTTEINSVTKSIRNGWTHNSAVNALDTFQFEVVSVDGSYRPVVDQEVHHIRSGTRIFGGYVQQPEESGILDEGAVPIITRVSCIDFNTLVNKRFANVVIPAGSLKAALQKIVPYLTSYGVSLDPAQATGHSMPALAYDYIRLYDILQEFSRLSGFVWEIDANKLLRMYVPGDVAAPFNLGSTERYTFGDIKVAPSRKNYVNRVLVRSKSGSITVPFETHNGNGSTRIFQLNRIPLNAVGRAFTVTVYNSAGVLYAGDVPVGVYGTDDVPWTFEAETNSLHQKATEPIITSTGYVSATYATSYVEIVDDLAEQASTGVISEEVVVVDTMNTGTMLAVGNAYLTSHNTTIKVVKFKTYQNGLKPGMVMTINIPKRNINNTFFITEVRSRHLEGDLVEHNVTATEGTIYRPELDWRNTYQIWSGKTGTGTAIGAGSVTTAAGYGRTAYWLGATEQEFRNWDSSGTPDWIPASNILASIDTVVRGSTAAVAYVQLRADSGTVTARIRNVSDGVTVGTSAPVASSTLTLVTFPITLTPGAKLYRLDILASLPYVNHQGMGGYIE